MRDNFAASLSATLKHEGGWVDHPADPGGATNMGITLKTLARWRNVSPWWNLPRSEVKGLKQSEAGAIYRELYWASVSGNALPAGVDFATFDFAVNSGPARAAIYLQNIVGAAPDGKIGPLTIKAVKAYCDQFGAGQLVNELCAQRLAFLQQLSTWPVFGKGWSTRVADVRKSALSMASNKPLPIDLPDDPEPAAPQKRKTLMDLLRGFFVRQATTHVVSTLKEHPQMLNFLPGIKTYLVGILMVLVAAASLLGVDVPAVDPNTALQTVMEGLAIIFLRKGIKNA